MNQNSIRTYIRAMGVQCDATPLEFADAAFEGNGPKGTMTIGVERKALHDMLNCMGDNHYSGKQRVGMKQSYDVSILMVEGFWKSREDGFLMESRDGSTWWVCRPHGKPVMYSSLRRYLMSIAYSGVIVNFTRDLQHTCLDICEYFHYHSKAWDKHTSLLQIHKLAIAQMNGKPSLVRQWAECCEGVGSTLGLEAEKLFRKPIRLATADETEWLRIPGMGVKKARSIVREIHGS